MTADARVFSISLEYLRFDKNDTWPGCAVSSGATPAISTDPSPLSCASILRARSSSLMGGECTGSTGPALYSQGMAHLLGIDIGTSGTKTLICDEDGTVLATATAEHPIFSPKPGWSEQNPEDWWQSTGKATKAVLKNAKLKAGDVGAIGLSGQMHGSVFLGDGTKALRPALLWNDQRTAEQCRQIEEKAGGRVALIELVANPALTGFTAPKILWVRQHEPSVYAKTKHILLPKDYIRFRMTGEYATEVSDASGTLLLDVVNRKWSDKLLGLLEIDKALMPRLHESPEVTGALSREAAKEMGLREGIQV